MDSRAQMLFTGCAEMLCSAESRLHGWHGTSDVIKWGPINFRWGDCRAHTDMHGGSTIWLLSAILTCHCSSGMQILHRILEPDFESTAR